MMVVVCYDVDTKDRGGAKRLRHVAKACLDYGQRVQFSVFECLVEPHQWVELRDRLRKECDLQKDCMRFYFLGKNWEKRVEHLGTKVPVDPEGTLIV
ncbi:MAG TPA: CRISPR-associated endonuclease Cas2 [Candidatus Aminicenantes bacterium]|nr:CRISPR-associated endonuclease Cas2 [Candidatus Aminicenantes bacterium]